MKQLLTILTCSISLHLFSQLPAFDWAFINASLTDNITSTKVLTDAQGNIYVGGYYTGSPDFDPSLNLNTLTVSGGTDGFIAKYDPSGNYLWAKDIGSSLEVHDMSLNSNGDLILVGLFLATSDFDPGSGIYNVAPASGYTDMFVLKLNNQGDFQFVKTFGNISEDYAKAVTTDSQNNIYFTGHFTGTVDFDASTNITNLSSGPKGAVFVYKMNDSGDLIWAKPFVNQGSTADALGGTHDEGTSIQVDSQGDVHVSGEFYGTVDFNPATAINDNISFVSSGGAWSPNINVFYAKLSSIGDFISAHSILSRSPSMQIDSSDNIYLSGKFINSTTDFDPNPALEYLTIANPGETFLRKMNANGTFIWVKNLNYKKTSWGVQNKNLTIDPLGNVYVSDEFDQSFDSDPTSNVNSVNISGAINNRNVFITRFNSAGSFDYTVTYGSVQSFNAFGSITVDNMNSIISVGVLNGSNACDFDPSGNLYELTGGTNYVQKLAQCSNSTAAFNIVACQNYTSPSGQSLNTNGIYLDTIPNAAGCDSIITINLTITQPTTSSIAPNICSNSYTAPDGQIYTQSGTYSAVIPNAAGCDSTITINLILTPAPIVNAGADQTICEGTTVTLSGTGATVYNWSDGIINAVAFQPPAGTINYIVTGTSANGCTDTDTVTVVVNPLPIVSFTGDNTTGCSPLSVALMSDFQYAYCNWIIDGMSYSDSTCDMLFLNFNSGCHDVTLQQTTAEGCMNQLSMLDFICVQSTPTSGFIASPLVITDLNTPVTFTNTTVPTVLSAWDFDDGTGTYETNPVHYFQTNQEADTFHVILYSQMSFPDGCISSSSLYIYYIPSDVVPSDVSIPTGFSPNNDGANDTWTISGLENYPNATINVFNRWGQLLFEGGPSNPTWNGMYLGELLPTADYYYIIDLGEGSKYNGVVTLKQ